MAHSELTLPQELEIRFKSLTRCMYIVADEEDEVLRAMKALSRPPKNGRAGSVVKVFNQAFGLVTLDQLLSDWDSRAAAKDVSTADILAALDKVYKEDPLDSKHFYVITDPERWLKDPNVVRRVLNVIHQIRHQMNSVKALVFLGQNLVVPQKLANYIHVVHCNRPSEEDLKKFLGEMNRQMKREEEVSPQIVEAFKGLTFFEAETALSQSLIETRHDPDKGRARRVDPDIVHRYKKERVKKTDLLNMVDVSKVDFSKIGGLDRFKAWAEKVKPSWSQAGRDFGLRPPKGVLCVGVWGCGKSLSVKALGSAWKLPVVQLEMGKLRSSAVGETEANVYRAISFLEAMAPCIAWVDEAEKSFAGLESSHASDSGTGARALGILSTWHQETQADVCLALTANSLKTLPTEFTNRIEDRFFFDVPDQDDRIEIFKIQLRTQGRATEAMIQQFNLLDLSKAAEGMVPREMEQAIRQALRESFFAKKPALDEQILLKELQERPRILKTMDAQVKEVLDWVGFDSEKGEGVRARMASSRQSKDTMQILMGGKDEV